MLKNHNYNFQNRLLVIATKHHKEKVIGPIFSKELNVVPFTPEDFDTDSFGTFTGEKHRSLSSFDTARMKCLEAMKKTGADLAIASEGSFGMHPEIGFIPLDEEILVLIDHKYNLEISVVERSLKTNYHSGPVNTHLELIEFCRSVQFPTHGIILKQNSSNTKLIIKDCKDLKELIARFNELKKNTEEITAETDMRAMNNPTRMKVIKNAALKLAQKVKSKCPHCGAPGFGINNVRRGLKCSNCSLPTRSVEAYIQTCIKCSFNNEIVFPHNKTVEDPQYCDFCNP